MIKLYCESGYYRDKLKRYHPCVYYREFPDSALQELALHVKLSGFGGFHCPSCRKFPLKVKKTKKEPES